MGIFTITRNSPASTQAGAIGPEPLAGNDALPHSTAPAQTAADAAPQCRAPAAPADDPPRCAVPQAPNPLARILPGHAVHPDFRATTWPASTADEPSAAAPHAPNASSTGFVSGTVIQGTAVGTLGGTMNLAEDPSGWDHFVDAVDFVTDYTMGVKAAVKAAARGRIEDAIVLGTSPFPLPPDVKLGIWDGEKDMAVATAKHAAMAAAGPLAMTADRVNELRKGNVAGAFPEVAGVAQMPVDLYQGAKKIAQGDVREGVRQMTPPVLTIAGAVEGFLAASRGTMGPATAPAGAPKQLPAGAPKQLPAGAAAEAATGTSGTSGAGASRNTAGSAAEAVHPSHPSSHTIAGGETGAMHTDRVQRRAEAPVRAQQRQEMADQHAAHEAEAARRSAQARASWPKVLNTMPTPFETISVERAFAGLQQHGWPTSASMTSARHTQIWRDLGRSGDAPPVFREGNNIRIDFERLSPAQQLQFRDLVTEKVTNANRKPIGDITVDVHGATRRGP